VADSDMARMYALVRHHARYTARRSITWLHRATYHRASTSTSSTMSRRRTHLLSKPVSHSPPSNRALLFLLSNPPLLR
jgi:hypothetical protein